MTDLVSWLSAQLDRDDSVFDAAAEGLADWPVDYLRRTIAAHRAILAAYRTALTSRDAAAGTVLAGATRLSLRLREDAVRSIAAIYEGRDGWDPAWKVDA